MKNKFQNIILNNFPFLKSAKLLLTVSAGIDSVILTHLLYQLKFDISIAHCNFHLRGTDSDNDQKFVQQLASNLNVPFYTIAFNTKEYAKQQKLSTQEAARNLRYEWFEKIREENKLDYILTAHNLNDSLETFLINLSRGTGLKGLIGIPTTQNKIIRPLSSFTRDEIISFALENNIKWREDKSNIETKYTRNKIRHQVIPILQELNPNLLDSFKNTLENLQGSQDILQDAINSVQTQLITSQRVFNIENLTSKIKTNPKAYIYEIFSTYGFTNPIDIIDLLSAQSGKQIFSKTHRLLKNRGALILSDLEENTNDSKEFSITEKTVLFKESNLNLTLKHLKTNNTKIKNTKNVAQFDKDLLKFPLTVRKWQNGDYFYPIGMRGKKKLSKYFKDEKLSLIDKENIWLLLSDNEIVWIIGMRQDERFKITNKTNTITKITTLS